MNFIKYLLGASMLINLYYLYNYSILITLNSLKYVIPETENDYPILTKENLRGMSQEVKNVVKTDIINMLIDEHWNSVYNGVILATGQENVSSYTASLNCYQHMVHRSFDSQGYTPLFEKIWIQKKLCRLLGSPFPLSNKEYLLKSTGKDLDVIFESSNIPKHLYTFLSGDPSTAQSIMGTEILYVPNRDLQYDEPTLTNINLAKHRIIQFKFNSTEIEDLLEFEIERKIVETFPNINIKKTYSECCQKFILNW